MRGLSKNAAAKYARAFRVSPAWLIYGSGSESQFSKDEIDLLEKYRSIEPIAQHAVRVVAESGVDSIAQRLRLTREALGLTQSALCKMTGIAANTYNQWEHARGRPELDKALILCEVLSLTLDWIYRGDPFGLPARLFNNLFSGSGDPCQLFQEARPTPEFHDMEAQAPLRGRRPRSP